MGRETEEKEKEGRKRRYAQEGQCAGIDQFYVCLCFLERRFHISQAGLELAM